jgi:DNA-binding MarR family transcriptional regulator
LVQTDGGNLAIGATLVELTPRIIQVMRRTFRQGKAELSVPQFRTLVFVQFHRGIALSELAEHLALRPPTVTRIVDGLQARGLLDRGASGEDRRRKMLTLTPLGKAFIVAHHAQAAAALGEMLAVLSEQEAGNLSAGLTALRRVLDEAGVEHPLKMDGKNNESMAKSRQRSSL